MVRLMSRFRSTIGYTGLCLLLAAIGIVPAFASDGGALGQSFKTKESLETGALVSLQQNDAQTVELSNVSRVSQLLGVVATKPLIELSGADSTVTIVTSGTTQALVSDINGGVKTGDKITASPINGVGMKATDPSLIVGTAQNTLSNDKTTSKTLTDRDGKSKTVHIGLIPVQINVTYYSPNTGTQSFIPSFLQDAANTFAGKSVSPVRVLASLVLAIIALVSVTILLYSSVRSSLISIGRNPLSETAIHKGLIEVGAIIIAILVLTFVAIYLILVLS